DLIDVARVSLDHDLFVLKSRSDLAMSVAADLHGAGARVLNPYPVSALLRDRVVTFRVLRAAGVPVPETFAASHASQLLPAPDRAYVVDMSSFPAFRGVPDAARRVAKYVFKAAERAACGEPVVPAELQRAPGRAATRALKGSSLQLVLGALSGTEATPQELAQIESVVDDIRLRSRAATSPPRVRPGRPRRDSRPTQPPSPPRVAMYSQGMVGFGHIRRNASIAQALRASELQPAIVMIAEAWQAGALLL